MMLNSAVPHLLVVAWSLFVAIGTSAAQPGSQKQEQEKDPLQTARTTVQRALGIGDIARALQTYETVREKDPSHGELLRSIAVARATQLRKDADPRIRIDACAAILLAVAERSCVDELTKLANDEIGRAHV